MKHPIPDEALDAEVARPVGLFPVPLERAECVLQLPRDLTVAEAEKIGRFVKAMAEMNVGD